VGDRVRLRAAYCTVTKTSHDSKGVRLETVKRQSQQHAAHHHLKLFRPEGANALTCLRRLGASVVPLCRSVSLHGQVMVTQLPPARVERLANTNAAWPRKGGKAGVRSGTCDQSSS